MKKFLVGIILAIPFISCKTQKTYTPDNYDKEIITFGSGGGFSGKVTKYQLLQNGQLFTKAMGAEHSDEMSPIDEKVAKQLFSLCENLGIDNMELDDPGNMYYYVSHSTPSGKHNITWGGKNVEVPQKVKAFYRTLNQLVKENTGIIR